MEASAAWAPPPTRQAKWRECLLPRPATHPLLLSRICLPNEHGISKTMGGGKSGKDFSPGNWFPFQTLHIANYISFKWSFPPHFLLTGCFYGYLLWRVSILRRLQPWMYLCKVILVKLGLREVAARTSC